MQVGLGRSRPGNLRFALHGGAFNKTQERSTPVRVVDRLVAMNAGLATLTKLLNHATCVMLNKPSGVSTISRSHTGLTYSRSL